MSSNRRRAQLDVIGLVAFEVVAVVVLQRLGARPDIGIGWRDPGSWLASTPVDQLVMSVVWLVALVIAWWTLGSTLLYLALRISAPRAGARIAERLAFPVVRRVVDRAIAATLMTSALMGAPAAALAAEQAPRPIPRQAPAVEAPTVEYEPRPAGSEEAERPDDDGGERGAGGSSDQGDPPGAEGSAPRPVRPVPGADPDAPDPWQQSDAVDEGGLEGGEAGGEGGERSVAPDEASGTSAEAATADAVRDAAERVRDAAEDARGAAGRSSETGASEGDEAQGDGAARDSEQAPDDDAEDRDREGRDGADSRSDRSERNDRRSTPQAGHLYTVRVGDHLWKIATEVVASGGGPGDRQAVASYWADLVRAATPGLRSGDPNLIYPGEEIDLPPVADRMGGRR